MIFSIIWFVDGLQKLLFVLFVVVVIGQNLINFKGALTFYLRQARLFLIINFFGLDCFSKHHSLCSGIDFIFGLIFIYFNIFTHFLPTYYPIWPVLSQINQLINKGHGIVFRLLLSLLNSYFLHTFLWLIFKAGCELGNIVLIFPKQVAKVSGD